jgi:hypothetical protein
MRVLAAVLALAIPCAAVIAQAPAAAPQPAYRVIVHPHNPVYGVERSFLADAFLKKVTRWRHNQAIRVADLVDSPARRRFSDEVLRRSVLAVRSYWQQQIFSGRGIPPPELEDDRAVVRFVQQNVGAVGYVSGHAELAGVKVLAVR